jgi:murein DD-endopeptidase MepM/ murein hydrolase activator NlpD
MGTFGTLGRCAAILVLAVFGVVAAFATIPPSREAPLPAPRPLVEALPLHARELPGPASYIREDQFRRGDTLAAFLARLGIAELQAQRLARLRALRELRPGSHVSAEIGAEGNPLGLSFLTGRDALVRIVPDGDAYAVSETRAALQMQVSMKSSVIRSSLFAASDAAGIPDSVAIQLADVFAGDIDFYRDLRKGDRFTVVYELHYFGGRPVRAGRVLAAEFLNQGKSFRAVHFGSSYYTPDGTNLRKAFLRSPLEFSRVTSRFGMRMHPMFSTWRAHKGIDYAAAVGTRVRAVGDGIVEFVGVNGGYGKAVVLRHYGQYTTLYAHLSRFPAGLHRGVRLAQNDTIGFVGQTGWATGPHLHYEFQVAGQARNPLSIAMPAGQPVAAQQITEFRIYVAPLITRLDLLANSDIALLE